jgi:hypothetical protein
LKRKPELTFVEKTKLFIFDNMEKYGFWAIICAASIPNPLFDLVAGRYSKWAFYNPL